MDQSHLEGSLQWHSEEGLYFILFYSVFISNLDKATKHQRHTSSKLGLMQDERRIRIHMDLYKLNLVRMNVVQLG